MRRCSLPGDRPLATPSRGPASGPPVASLGPSAVASGVLLAPAVEVGA